MKHFTIFIILLSEIFLYIPLSIAQDTGPTQPTAIPQQVPEKATLWLMGGKTVSNSISDQKANAWAIEQETPTKYGIWNFGYQNEGHKGSLGDKRDGIYAMRKFSYQFTQKIQTSFAIGPYFTATTVTQPDSIHYQDTYRLDLLSGASIQYKLTDNLSTIVRWNHVLYTNGKDTDVFLIGAGYSPASW